MTLLLIVVVGLILSISWAKLHPFFALLAWGLIYGVGAGMGAMEVVETLLTGFAQTLKWIALIMVLGTLIGEIANETGGARRIASGTLKAAGERNIPVAMGATGYLVSIPVFVDVAYIMMRSVTEAIAARSKQGVLAVGLSLAAGLTASHALVPPTPGPLAGAGILDAELGRLILINSFVAFAATAGGIAWAYGYVSKTKLDYDEKLQRAAPREDGPDDSSSPSLLLALLPIAVPLVLIASRAFLSEEATGPVVDALRFLGLPLVAMLVGVLLALLQYGKGLRMTQVGKVTERAIEKAALVIFITGMGGAFGHVIRQSGVTETLADNVAGLGALGFLFPFLLAAIFTTTTGSITVSMITTASIIVPFLPQLGLSPEMAVALIGSGSFCVFHVNSSFFWLLNRLHEVPPTTLLRTYTLQSLCMGLSGLAAVGVLWLFGLR